MRLVIAIPSCRDWKAPFGASLCGLVRKLTMDGVDFDLHVMQGASVLPRARQAAVEKAIKDERTHILFIDDDMFFNNELFDDLYHPDYDVVAANYVTKNPKNPSPLAHGTDGQPVSSKDRMGLQEVGWVGFGATLISLKAIKDIPAPLFEMRWLEERKDFIGEDFYFCGKIRAYGVKIYVNHDAKVAHVGDFAYIEQGEV